MKKPTKPTAARNLPAKTSSKALSVVDEFDSNGAIPKGLENVTSSDLIIPRLTILQDLSPQLKKKRPEYIEGAAPGMFCDVGTGELFEELHILPVFYAKLYLEWAPRGSSQRGPVHNYGTDSSIMSKTKLVEDEKGSKKPMLPNGNLIAETATYFLLNLSARGRRSFLPMTSTQLGSSKRWMMQITNERVKRSDGSEFQPPIYYRSWIARAAEDQRPKGDFFGWAFTPGKTVLEIDPTKKLLEEAKEFYAQAQLGNVRGDVVIEEDDNTGEGRM